MLATKPNFYVSCLTSKKIYHLILRLCHLAIYTLNFEFGRNVPIHGIRKSIKTGSRIYKTLTQVVKFVNPKSS